MDLPQKLLDRTCERRPAASRLSPFVRGTIRAIFPIVPLTKGDSREAAGGRSHVRSNSFCCHPFVHTFDDRGRCHGPPLPERLAAGFSRRYTVACVCFMPF